MEGTKSLIMQRQNYDNSISFVRVLAMIFIVICHLGSHFGSVVISQFFNVGVQIFFLISGYLYGDRQITEPGKWLFKRYLRLEIPALIWLGIYCFFAIFERNPLPKPHQVAFILLNLEGLNFILSAMPSDIVIGPWFFTNIMACYILLLLYQRLREKHAWAERIFSYGGTIPLVVFVLFGMLQISTDGALAFFMGVALKRRGLLEQQIKYNIFVAVACFAVAVALRLVANRYIDGSVLYNEVIAPGTHVMIAGAFVVSMKWLFGSMPKIMNQIAQSKLLRHLDRISVYLYISHGWFITPVFSSVTFCNGAFATLIYICLIVTVSSFLCLLGEWVTWKVEHGICYLLG